MGSIAAESRQLTPVPSHHHSGGGLVVARPTRCLLLLQGCLAVKLQRVSTLVSAHPHQQHPPKQGHEFWMYDSGYRLFQSFLEANLRCFWNPSLLEAMRQLQYQGYVAPGVLLVSADPCALEIIRAAWGRKTLQPPSNHIVTLVGDVEECLVQSLPQSQFTPLPEALCWVVLELTSAGQPASLEAVRAALQRSFPAVMETPSEHTIYDALAKLMQERKIYHTSRGYFVVTPESRRRRSNSQGRPSSRAGHSVSPHHRSSVIDSVGDHLHAPKTVLMSTDEALAYIHGEMETIRDGDRTHQAVQTNLADVICGGNPNDKVLYPRAKPTPSPGSRILERRHSMRLFGSKKRLSHSTSLPRCGSMRLSPTSSRTMDWGDVEVKPQEKSPSFLSRLFRRNGTRNSNKRLSRADGSESGESNLSTFSAQFPPAEWFNPSVTHLHSVGTQTRTSSYSLSATRSRDTSLGRSQASIPWSEDPPSRAATLPRRRRHISGDTNFTFPSGDSGSYSNTPRSYRKSSNPPSCNGTLRAPSRQRSTSSSNGSKHTGSSPGTSITGGAPSIISSFDSPRSKISPTSSTLLNTPRVSPIKSPSPTGTPKPVLPPGTTSIPGSIITLQVRTNAPSDGRSPLKLGSNDMTTTTASFSGNGSARVCVLQSPNRSVVTLNGTPVATPTHSSPGSVVDAPVKKPMPRPSSCYLPKEKKLQVSPLASFNKKCPSVENLPDEVEIKQKVANNNQPIPKVSNSDAENQLPESSMNNVNSDVGRKRSETLSSLKNLLYHSNTELSSLGNNNSSSALKTSLDKPLKPSDSLNLLENLGKTSLTNGKSIGEDNELDKINGDLLHSSFPSLSDLTVHFKSLTAQKILKGISINSIDTLVEVNMAAAANEKQNNCDVSLHTDFGVV
ncbi:mucin-12 [Neocloeon triangulifer]|uniref:mucin-12 n=1 Tax=Neocloeon triangulifer TaxID=2078957 RepID=UPI00286F464E|nr:mucin-12 [Neocloeon triangulifer]XP_059478234.1 mucin-12 [Neocloeon triangulifer]